MQVLIVSIATTYVSNVGAQILVGAGHVRIVALALIVGSALNVGITLALIRPLGLVGVAIATVAASVVIDLITIPMLVQRTLHLRVLEFVRRACPRPALVALLCAPLLALLRHYTHAGSWTQLLAIGVAAGTSCAIVAALVGITREERSRLLIRPLNALLGRPAGKRA
jgi:O-antigen/teichoic acid export membrane protein